MTIDPILLCTIHVPILKGHYHRGRLYNWATILQILTKVPHMTLWLLDDLWPHPPMHHPCSCTQGSLPPSLIKIDGRLYKWAAISQTSQTYVHIHTNIHVRTHRNSDYIVSSWTLFRRDKNAKIRQSSLTLDLWQWLPHSLNCTLPKGNHPTKHCHQ